jgi:hypothetical protein
MTLAERQRAMRLALLAADPHPPEGIVEAGVPAGLRFAVHVNTVLGTLSAALKAAFPATARLLGEAAFGAAAVAFVRAHPPRLPQLSAWGAGFPDHLETQAQALAIAPAAGDLARLEWAWVAAHFAADAPRLDGAALRAVPMAVWPDLRLRLHPSAALLTPAWRVIGLWERLRHDDGESPALPVPTGPAAPVLVVRPGLEVLVSELAPGEAAFLSALTAGASLDEAAAAATLADAGTDLQDVLVRHLGLGTLAGFDMPSDG